MKFVILGNVCLDHNRAEKTFYKAAGGPITFMSTVLRQLPNAHVKAISSYGPDFKSYKKNLRLYPDKANVSNTLVYKNIIKNGKRTQKCHFYKTNLPVKIDKNFKKLIRQTNVLFITPLLPNFSPSYLKKVVSFTKKNSIKILLPQGYFRKFNKDNKVLFRQFTEAGLVLSLVDIVILSSKDYPNIEKTALQWVKRHKIIVIITQEEKGAMVVNKDGTVMVSTKPVSIKNIVDSVGAGDIFGACFGYHYLQTKDLIKSVDFANKIARQSLFYPSSKIKIHKAPSAPGVIW